MNMGWRDKSGKHVKFFVYFIVVVLVNAAGITLFFRWDFTENKIYSISAASRKVVSTLSEPLSIKVFFTKNLPAPHNTTERYLHDLLEEYAIYANKYFNYRFYDVSPEEGEISADSRENQKLANNYGIHPVQIQAIEKDEVKFKRAYMGLVIIHGDLIERIETISTTEGLEYKLTTAIQKLNNKISVLLSLSDKIKVKLFLSSSLEKIAPYIGLQNLPQISRNIEEIVTRLNQKNYDRLDFEVLAPSAEKDLDEISNRYNIMTLKWPTLSDGKIPAGRGAIGVAMQYGDKTLTIPLLQVIRIPILGTQYKLTDMDKMEEIIEANVEALIDINEDLGYLSDHGTLSVPGSTQFDQTAQQQTTLSNFHNLMSQNYTLKNINLKGNGIPEGLTCLVITRPTEKFSDYELFQIDQFLMQGKSLFLILDRFNEVMPTNQQGLNIGGRGPAYVPLNTGLEKLLEYYGIRIKNSYVMDENCFRQQLPSRLGGGDRQIYFAPLIKKQHINTELEFMKTIKAMVALKISPLELITERISETGLRAHQLFASSEKSWEMRGRINLNPLFIHPPASTDEMQSQPLAYLLEGEFPSYFDGKPIPIKAVEEKEPDQPKDGDASEEKTQETESSEQKSAQESDDKQLDSDVPQIISKGQFTPKSKPAKIFIMASSEMLTDNVLDATGRGSNATFIMNVVDYLNGREDIAVMRGKEQRFNPLNDTSAAAKTFVKAFNIAGLPILVAVFGLAVWFRRHSRKKQIQMMFQK